MSKERYLIGGDRPEMSLLFPEIHKIRSGKAKEVLEQTKIEVANMRQEWQKQHGRRPYLGKARQVRRLYKKRLKELFSERG